MRNREKQSVALPALDRAAVDAEARAWVDERLAPCAGDPARLLQTASKLIDSQAAPFERARAERDAIALSIREYGPDATEPVPVNMRNVRLAEASGISRPRLQKLRTQLPHGHAVALVPEARKKLPRVARRAALYESRMDYARELRDTALAEAFKAGWKNAEIARLMSRDPSRIAHMRSKLFKEEQPLAS